MADRTHVKVDAEAIKSALSAVCIEASVTNACSSTIYIGLKVRHQI